MIGALIALIVVVLLVAGALGMWAVHNKGGVRKREMKRLTAERDDARLTIMEIEEAAREYSVLESPLAGKIHQITMKHYEKMKEIYK